MIIISVVGGGQKSYAYLAIYFNQIIIDKCILYLLNNGLCHNIHFKDEITSSYLFFFTK